MQDSVFQFHWVNPNCHLHYRLPSRNQEHFIEWLISCYWWVPLSHEKTLTLSHLSHHPANTHTHTRVCSSTDLAPPLHISDSSFFLMQSIVSINSLQTVKATYDPPPPPLASDVRININFSLFFGVPASHNPQCPLVSRICFLQLCPIDQSTLCESFQTGCVLVKTERLQVHHAVVPCASELTFTKWLPVLTWQLAAGSRRVDQEECEPGMTGRPRGQHLSPIWGRNEMMCCCGAQREQTVSSGRSTLSGDVVSPPHLFSKECQKCHYSCQMDIIHNSNLIQQQNILWCSQRE